MQATSADYYFESYNHYGVHEARKNDEDLVFLVNFRDGFRKEFPERKIRHGKHEGKSIRM